MKRFIIILTILLSIIQNGNTQNGQSLLWGDSLFVGPSFGEIDNNGNLIIAGALSGAQPERNGFVLKIKDNKVIKQYFHPEINDTTGTIYKDIAILDNSNYLCFGTQYNGNHEKWPAIITLLDSNLNFIKETVFDLPPQYTHITWYGASVIESEDSILYAFSAAIPEGVVYSDLGLLRVNSSGDTIESRYHHYEYQYGGGVTVYDISRIPQSDKYFAICNHIVFSDELYSFIINPDLSVDTMYEYANNSIDKEAILNIANWSGDNTFLTAGSYTILPQGDFSLFAGHFNTEGEILEMQLLNQTGMQEKSANARPIVYANDSTIYIAGYDMCFTCNPITDVAILEVYTVNSQLDVLGYNVIADDGFYRASGVLTNEEGDLIVFGTKNVGNTFNYNLFVKQIPREELGLTTTVKTYSWKTQASVFPNPASKTVNFRIDKDVINEGVRITLQTVTGKKVLSKPVQGVGNTLQVDVSDLPKGVILYQITKNKKIISQGKFIKQ